jgi:hypothetical protein
LPTLINLGEEPSEDQIKGLLRWPILTQ